MAWARITRAKCRRDGLRCASDTADGRWQGDQCSQTAYCRCQHWPAVGMIVRVADVQDRDGAPTLLARRGSSFPWLRRVFADAWQSACRPARLATASYRRSRRAASDAVGAAVGLVCRVPAVRPTVACHCDCVVPKSCALALSDLRRRRPVLIDGVGMRCTRHRSCIRATICVVPVCGSALTRVSRRTCSVALLSRGLPCPPFERRA